MTAPTFTEWANGPDNPLSRASERAKFFAEDALKAAFRAGQEFERELWKVKSSRSMRSSLENIFK